MPKQILIVDDIKTNREILKNILGTEYRVLEAADGQEAVAVMEREYAQLSVVLLDLGMPVMDGFSVLSLMQQSDTLSKLPVIVMTGQTDADSEEKALKLGAKDYISKPYKSAIIKQRIWNTIHLRETAAAINALQRDPLTGLYSREAFFERVSELTAAHAPGHYVMACFDIDSFKVVNDQYGTQKGDAVLCHVADVFRAGFTAQGGLCCRVTADNFAVLYPAVLLESEALEQIKERACRIDGLAAPLSFSVGRYIVSDPALPPSAMYDRAMLAEVSIKGRYDCRVALYDESMRDYLLHEQKIVTEMNGALKSRQFEVWFQPQYNHSSGALIGAEALVRWRHPERGLIPPDSFIPIFEKNGFVYDLDKFVWEETCRCLQKWIGEGRSPLPVSVNVSRYDIFRPDLTDVLSGLIETYRIPVELLRLEVTESAFAESTAQIVQIVRRLIDYGFTVEIDDFGSGYSSLNTLKNVPAQVVKLDMRFLEDDDGSDRGGNILESIVRMTKWLGMSVIAEGVEKKAQADFLKSIGCNYVQGFLYARPMPVADYEAFCKGAGKEERLLSIETVENLDNNAFWNPSSMDTLIFNSYVGGACIFEFYGDRAEILRVNDKYVQAFGEGASIENIYKTRLEDYMDEANREILLGNIRRAVKTGRESTCETFTVGMFGQQTPVYIRSTVQMIARSGNRCLLYCTVINTTAQRLAEQSQRRLMQQLQAVMDNVNCGITAVAVNGEFVEYLLTNDRYFKLLGYTKAQYEAEVGSNAFVTIHPEDRQRVTDVVASVAATGVPTEMEYRILRRDGEVLWLRSSVSMTDFEGVEGRVQLSTYTNVTGEKLAAQELLDNLPCGAALFASDGTTLTAVHLNRRYWELVGRAPLDYRRLPVADAIHPDDRAVVAQALKDAIAEGRDVDCDIRIRSGSGGYRAFHIIGRILPRADGKYAIYTAYTPISDEALSIQEMLPVALQAMMDAQSGFSFVKDRQLRYVCCSRDLYESIGLRSEAEMVGKTDRDLLPLADAERYAAVDRRVLETGEAVLDSVALCPAKGGKDRYSSTSKFPIKDSRGNIIGIYGVGQDVTETRAMRSALELLTNNLPGGIATYEGSADALDCFRLTYFSDGFCRLFGYTREEYASLAAENPLGLVFLEDLPGMAAQIEALVRRNVPMDCVYRARVKDGSYKWINLKAVMGEPHAENLTVNAVLFDVSARQEALERLRVSEEENRLAIAQSDNVVCRYDVAARRLMVSPGVNPIFEVPPVIEDVPDASVRMGEISPETAEDYLAFYGKILCGKKSGEALYQRKSTAGWRWIEAHFSTIFSDGGAPVSAVISFADVTERLEKEAVYKRWKQSVESKRDGSYSLFRCKVGKETVVDSAEGTLLTVHFAPGPFFFDEHTAQYVAEYVLAADAECFSAFLNVDALLAAYLRGDRTLVLEYREKQPKDACRWLRLTVDLVEAYRSADVVAYLLFEDIDAAKRAELLTIARAETDPLTAVLNRAVFADRVDRLLRAARPEAEHALLMLDIDGFKLVNDAFGHTMGDQALLEIADSIRSVLRRSDLVGRLGGDEFAVFLTDLPGDAAAAGKAQQICAMTRKAFSMEVEISGSVGIAVTPRDGADFATLYKKADAALYHVKGSGKDNYAFFHEDMLDEHFGVASAPALVKHAEKKRRMLIVDDSVIDHALLSNIFADDFIIEKAKDGNAALIRLRHYGMATSVVLLDLMMPGMDGFAVLERMQRSAEMRSIPVVVVSGDENRETSLRAIRAGASDFVTKPVDPDVLRIRVQSAISKAENERLRAKNSVLEYKAGEIARYKTVLARSGVAVVEHDWITGEFLYDPGISELLAGVYDDRRLWRILLADLVADTATVKAMQEFTHDIATDRQRPEGSLSVQLKAPSGAQHWFCMNVYRVFNEFGLTEKLYLAFRDLGTERPEAPKNA